jgi:DNA-binding beta-propeller fold protein YncE
MSKVIAALVVACAVAGHAAAQTPCAHRLFVSEYFVTVRVFDACTGEYLRDLDSPSRIRGAQAVKLGPDGLLYVTSEISQEILRYRNDTLEFVDVFATIPGIDPTGFAFAPNGDVYVAGFRTDQVRRLSAAGAALDIPVPAGTAGLDGPDNGIAFAPDGNLYVPGYNSSNVIRHDPRTGATTAVVVRAAQGLFHTRGILPDRNGAGIYITGEGSGQLLRLDFATGQLTVLASALISPTGIDYAPDGSLLIVDGRTVARFDPATGARLGTLVPATGRVETATYLAVIAKPPPPKVAAVEYYNLALDHYFVSALAADIAALDSGALTGWTRTGLSFGAYLEPAAGTSPVCRFYLPPQNGDSHFYSASPAECADVRARFPSFVLEAPDVMHVTLPDLATGACPPGTQSVYRLWNNRVDSNHRYTADVAVKAAMTAKGYVAEGYGPDAVIMCAAV